MIIRHLGEVPYEDTWENMKKFNNSRVSDTPDEIWILQHPPVFTLGFNGNPELLPQCTIPSFLVDRGGQITYHGPGQVIFYLLLDLKRLKLGVRALVNGIEESIVQLLKDEGILAHRRSGAPGVYVAEAKIAALGLRIKRQCCYHGLSLNVDMDLTPFSWIQPCGYEGLKVTQTKDMGIQKNITFIEQKLLRYLQKFLLL